MIAQICQDRLQRVHRGGEGRTRMKQMKFAGIDYAALALSVLFLAGVIVLRKFGL